MSTKSVSGASGELELVCEVTPADWGEMVPLTAIATLAVSGPDGERRVMHSREIDFKR